MFPTLTGIVGLVKYQHRDIAVVHMQLKFILFWHLYWCVSTNQYSFCDFSGCSQQSQFFFSCDGVWWQVAIRAFMESAFIARTKQMECVPTRQSWKVLWFCGCRNTFNSSSTSIHGHARTGTEEMPGNYSLFHYYD